MRSIAMVDESRRSKASMCRGAMVACGAAASEEVQRAECSRPTYDMIYEVASICASSTS